MTEWATINIPKELKKEIEEEFVENGTYSSASNYIQYQARKGLEDDLKIEEKIKEIVKEEALK